MGGAFITVEGKTEKEVEEKLQKEIKKASKVGLETTRGASPIQWDDDRKLFIATIWLHS